MAGRPDNHSHAAPFWGAALRRGQAAQYCGHSPGHFDKLVKNGTYPPGRDADGVIVWLRWELDEALASLPTTGGQTWGGNNSCDDIFEALSG